MHFISTCAVLHMTLHPTQPFSLMVYCTFAWKSACNIISLNVVVHQSQLAHAGQSNIKGNISPVLEQQDQQRRQCAHNLQKPLPSTCSWSCGLTNTSTKKGREQQQQSNSNTCLTFHLTRVPPHQAQTHAPVPYEGDRQLFNKTEQHYYVQQLWACCSSVARLTHLASGSKCAQVTVQSASRNAGLLLPD